MAEIKRIRRVPANFGAFIEEVAAGIGKLYGPAAGEEYRINAPRHIASNVTHPNVYAFAARVGTQTAALLFASLRDGAGQIAFTHVLAPYLGQGHEGRLVEAAAQALREAGAATVLSECVPLCKLHVHEEYAALGFERHERALMLARLDDARLRFTPPFESMAFPPQKAPEVAAAIVEAYEGHPGRRLHAEVRDRTGALRFVETAAQGGYGAAKPLACRMITRDGAVAAAIVSCAVCRDVGFILQVVTRPAYRRQGLGERLIREACETFRREGIERVALGVTLNNPAMRLYERLGFQTAQLVDAYTWRQDEP